MMRGLASVLVALGLTEAWVHVSPPQALAPSRRHPGSAPYHRSHGMPSTETRGAVSAMARSAAARSAAATPEDPELSDLAEVTSSESADQSALAQRLQGGFGPTVWSEFGSLGR